jgi:hypothetical protein
MNQFEGVNMFYSLQDISKYADIVQIIIILAHIIDFYAKRIIASDLSKHHILVQRFERTVQLKMEFLYFYCLFYLQNLFFYFDFNFL